MGLIWSDLLCRNVPADSGWVLDGFPVNMAQAVMLENALSGTHIHEDTSEDPRHPALDVVVLLDVSDEQVLERAAREITQINSSLSQFRCCDLNLCYVILI